MAYTDVDICNLALTRIGAPLVSSRQDGTPTSELVFRIYDMARDDVLGMVHWGFAKAVEALAGSSETYPGWDYVYHLPENIVRVRKVVVDDMVRDDYPYEIVHSIVEGEERLVTSAENAQLVYTPRIFDATVFPPGFVNTLAWRIAAELALPIRAEPKFGDFCYQNFRMALQYAAGVDAAQRVLQEGYIQGDNPYVEERSK